MKKNHFICVFFTLLLIGCKTQVIEKPVEIPIITRDTIKVVQKEVQTCYVTDSVLIKGDTIYRSRDRWRELVTHDTIYKVRHDTISVPVEITKIKEVERRASWVENGFCGLGVITFILGLAWAVGKIAKER